MRRGGARTAQLTSFVIERLTLGGATVWRQNSGRTGGVHQAPAGTPDVIGFSRAGRFIGVEIKADPYDKPNAAQYKFLERLRNANGHQCVARNEDLFLRWCSEEGL